MSLCGKPSQKQYKTKTDINSVAAMLISDYDQGHILLLILQLTLEKGDAALDADNRFLSLSSHKLTTG